jgi:polyhydroxyalkanoate synthase
VVRLADPTEVLERVRRDAQRAALRARNGLRHLSGVGHVGVGLSPREEVWSRDKVRLYRYSSHGRSLHPPVLLVMSLVTKPYVFDLRPGSSLVERMVARGFDVYLVDWGIPDVVESANTLETYCDEYIPRAARAAMAVAGADEITVFGYCLGGVLSLLSVAGHPELPVRNLAVQATPVDFSDLSPAVTLMRQGRLQPEEFVDETGNVPASTVFDSMQLVKPTGPLTGYADLWQHLHEDEFVKAYQALMGWARDHIPLPGATYRQLVELFIKGNMLVTGRVPLGERTIDLADIRGPVLNIVGAQDHIVPPESTAPLPGLLANAEVTDLVLPAGHVGLIVGRQAFKTYIPAILDWLESHSESHSESHTESPSGVDRGYQAHTGH